MLLALFLIEMKKKMPWLKHKRGWLKNKDRLQRRDRPNTLTDAQVTELIRKIDEMDYTKLKHPFDKLIRVRDKALISLSWTFFKRGSENLKLTLKDIYITETELEVTFTINKKSHRTKTCINCGSRNSCKSVYCSQCGKDIRDIKPVEEKSKDFVATKRKSLKYPFCRTFVEWIVILKEFGCEEEHYVFPPFIYLQKRFDFENHLSVQRLDQILQKLDLTLTSSMFRYGHSEKLFRLGYTPFEVKEVGDWQSSRMPEIYAKRKGFTISQKKFSEDIRMIE